MGVSSRLSELRREIRRKTMMTPFEALLTHLARATDYASARILPPPRYETTVGVGGDLTLLLPPNLPSARRLHMGSYEPEVTRTLRALLRPGMTFIDAGANVGYYSLIAARSVADEGHVYSFEPEQTAHRYLELNVVRNGLRNVTTVQSALSYGPGSVAFIPNALEGSYVCPDGKSSPHSTLVEAVSLDGFLATQGTTVDIIKLDVEGGETHALEGMTETSKKSPQMRIVLEVNPRAMKRAGQSPDYLRQLLIQLGFRTYRIIELASELLPLSTPLPYAGFVYNLLLCKE